MNKREQLRLYQQMMGAEAAARQEKAANKARGACICNKRTVKQRWDETRVQIVTVHEQG